MPDQLPVNIVMIEDDEGHARLIEKNIRRAGILNDIKHFTEVRNIGFQNNFHGLLLSADCPRRTAKWPSDGRA